MRSKYLDDWEERYGGTRDWIERDVAWRALWHLRHLGRPLPHGCLIVALGVCEGVCIFRSVRTNSAWALSPAEMTPAMIGAMFGGWVDDLRAFLSEGAGTCIGAAFQLAGAAMLAGEIPFDDVPEPMHAWHHWQAVRDRHAVRGQ